jgi:FKBP-type peptidyl-prolyl cis-trans isomerase SlyD
MAIQPNQKVAIEYELTVDGNVVDSNVGREPLEFQFGAGQIIPGLESRIAHLNSGESAEVTVPAAEAYGEYNEEAMQVVPKTQLQGIEEEITVGMPLHGQSPDGNPIEVVVKEVRDDEIVVDFNHPLAGKDLTFAIKVLSIA